MKHLLFSFPRRILNACFTIERTTRVRSRVGKIAGRKVYSEKTVRSWHFEEANVLGALFFAAMGIEYTLNQWFGLSYLDCLGAGQGMICQFTGYSPLH